MGGLWHWFTHRKIWNRNNAGHEVWATRLGNQTWLEKNCWKLSWENHWTAVLTRKSDLRVFRTRFHCTDSLNASFSNLLTGLLRPCCNPLQCSDVSACEALCSVVLRCALRGATICRVVSSVAFSLALVVRCALLRSGVVPGKHHSKRNQSGLGGVRRLVKTQDAQKHGSESSSDCSELDEGLKVSTNAQSWLDSHDFIYLWQHHDDSSSFGQFDTIQNCKAQLSKYRAPRVSYSNILKTTLFLKHQQRSLQEQKFASYIVWSKLSRITCKYKKWAQIPPWHIQWRARARILP